MKAKIFFLALNLCLLNMIGQVVFSENFNSPFIPSAHGWIEQNNSVPLGSGTWFQGSANVFPAFNGQPNDFFACNYTSQGNSPGGISNFLITPTLNLVNGATVRFFTRTDVSAGFFPDRLQVLMSQGSGTGAISSGTSAVGTFTTLLNDINPNLTTSGYPVVWTGFTGTVSGVTGTVVGRFAFRYFVDNGGITGSNSNYIGIDSVSYVMPCLQSVFYISPTSTAICSGGSALLTIVTSLTNAPTSYSWNNGQTASSIVVSPTVTTVYSVNAQNAFGCVGGQSISIKVNPNPVVIVSVSNMTACANENIVLTASGANNYVWSGAATAITSTFIYSSASQGIHSFSVSGTSTAGCTSSASASVLINLNPVINAVATKTAICANNSVTFTASGADIYVWSGAGTSTTNPFIYTGGNIGGISQFTLHGTSTLTGCSGEAFLNLVVYGQGVCVGIEEIILNGNNLSVYPNPFVSEIHITGLKGKAEIYNALGQVLISVAVHSSETINTLVLPKGVYLMKAYDLNDELVKINKLIKN